MLSSYGFTDTVLFYFTKKRRRYSFIKMIALHRIFQRKSKTLVPITIPVNITRTQPCSFRRLFSPIKSVSERRAYRYIEILASIKTAILWSHLSVIGFETRIRIWNISDIANKKNICATQWSLKNIMRRLVITHLIRVRGFQYLPAKVSVFNPSMHTP